MPGDAGLARHKHALNDVCRRQHIPGISALPRFKRLQRDGCACVAERHPDSDVVSYADPVTDTEYGGGDNYSDGDAFTDCYADIDANSDSYNYAEANCNCHRD